VGTLDMHHAIEARASDLVMPDVMKIGGVTGWLRAAALAQAKGLRMSNHLWPEISARLLLLHADRALAGVCRLVESVLAEPLQRRERHAIAGDAIGTGWIGTKRR